MKAVRWSTEDVAASLFWWVAARGRRGLKEYVERYRFVTMVMWEEMFPELIDLLNMRCPFCGREFKQRSLLVRHLTSVRASRRCSRSAAVRLTAAARAVVREHREKASVFKAIADREKRMRRHGLFYRRPVYLRSMKGACIFSPAQT